MEIIVTIAKERMNLVVEVTERGNNLIIPLSGELDHHKAGLVREELDKKISESDADTLIFDLSGLNFMDSSGIGVMMGRYKLISQRGGRAFIAGANPRIEKLIAMSGLLKIMRQYGSVADALERSGQ